MDIEKQVFSIFSSFIRDLSKTFPEIKNCLYRNYEKEIVGDDLKLDDCLKIKSFLSIVNENSKLIENKDIKFFEIENILEEISFQRLWEKNISDKTKATIWKYFQTFIIININLNSSKQLQEALVSMNDGEITKEYIKDKQTAKDLKKLKKLAEDVKEEVKDEDELDLDNMLGGLMNTNIGSIAKEVASTMKLGEMLGDVDENTNPMELMAKMMNPEKMGNIFKNINSVMETKMKNGELNEDILKKEAQSMYSDMANNPLFGNLMKQMNPDSPVPESNDSNESNDTKNTTKELSKEEKKEKLKKKIEEKKKERTK